MVDRLKINQAEERHQLRKEVATLKAENETLREDNKVLQTEACRAWGLLKETAERALAERAGGVKGDAVSVIDTLIESLSEGLMTDAGLTKADRDAMKHQITALEIAKDGISALTTEPATPSETVITDNVSPYSYQIRASPETVLRCCTINGKSFCNDPDCDVHAGDTVTPTHREPRAYIVHAPEDDYYGTGPGRLQFPPLTQRDLDNGYRQTPLYTSHAEQAVTEARPNWNGWRSIDTAPEDCRVILATAGNWVGEAIMLRDEDTGEQVWTWVDTGKPSLHSCYGWMHLPDHLLAPVLSDLRPDGFDGPTGAE